MTDILTFLLALAPSPQLALELLSLGVVGGFLAGLLGIGGGMVLVPFMIFMMSAKGFSPELLVKMAIGTSLATICFTSVSSVRAHHRRGAVRWDLVRALAPGILLGSYLGGWVASSINSHTLAWFFAGFVYFSATQMFLDKKPKPTRQLPQAPGLFGAGGVIGTLSGMVGAGGGFISVPFMTWCNVPIHNAVATSAALGFPIALAGSISYIIHGSHLTTLPPGSWGYLYLPAIALIASASVLTAPLGANLAHRMNTRQLKKVFALVLYALATYMLYKGFNTP